MKIKLELNCVRKDKAYRRATSLMTSEEDLAMELVINLGFGRKLVFMDAVDKEGRRRTSVAVPWSLPLNEDWKIKDDLLLYSPTMLESPVSTEKLAGILWSTLYKRFNNTWYDRESSKKESKV